MTNFVTSSALTRLLANVFAFLVITAALAVFIIQTINNQPVNPLCYTVLSTAVGYVCSLLSVHTGSVLTTPPDQQQSQGKGAS